MSSTQSIAVSVKLDFWDAYRGALTVIVGQFRKFLTILGLATGLALTLLVLASFQTAPEGEWDKIQRNLTPFLWFLGLVICFLLVVPLLSARKALADEHTAGGAEYRFSDAGVHILSSIGNADLRWMAFPKAVETQSAFLLFAKTNMAHTLPKRCFANATEVAAMRELLRSNIPKAQLKQP